MPLELVSRAKKDMKKSSYYVWFLGAQEAHSARGARAALGALARLERRSQHLEPFKVTLQLSGKGLKIVQNVEARSKGGRTVKHFLPAESVTEARTQGDAVVCVLLLYNPATRCPLHAHAYRCDSEQTAQALCTQLRAVAGLGPEEDDEPESLEDISPPIATREARIDPRNDPRADPRIETRNDPRTARNETRVDPRMDLRNDIRNETRIDDSRGDRIDRLESYAGARLDSAAARFEQQHSVNRLDAYNASSRIDHQAKIESHGVRNEVRLAPEQEVVAERLAAELRARLGGREPLLLPPRDYDPPAVRRPPQPPAVSSASPAATSGRRLPAPARGPLVGSSAGSSGIGSDLAPSPDRPHTSSEEDWGESTAYMLHEGFDVSASPPRGRARSPSPPAPTRGRHQGSVSPKDRFNVAKEKFLNLEREKLHEEMEQRAQLRRNINNAISRGPMTPAEIKASNRRSNKWDDEDDLVERRGESNMRAIPRSDPRDIRNQRSSRDDVDRRIPRDPRDYRDGREYVREERIVKESRDMRDGKDKKKYLDDDLRDFKDLKPFKETREYRDYRDVRDQRDYRDVKDPRYVRESQRDVKDYREPKDPRDAREYKDQKDAKYVKEFRDVNEMRDGKSVDRRDSRERTPKLEQRYSEYRGERNDKHFESRYNNKHDSRSDDEGVESEKQFEEIRYVPHVEAPRRREPEVRRNGDLDSMERNGRKEPVRDGRIELLEERQRQMESRRLVPRPEERYDRSLEMQRRPQPPEPKEWDVVRRSYVEADRPRRDPRTRHSYAEPVARTRVGMATVAPF